MTSEKHGPKSSSKHRTAEETTEPPPPASSSTKARVVEKTAGILTQFLAKSTADERADLRVRLGRLFLELKGLLELARKHVSAEEFQEQYNELEKLEHELRSTIP